MGELVRIATHMGILLLCISGVFLVASIGAAILASSVVEYKFEEDREDSE